MDKVVVVIFFIILVFIYVVSSYQKYHYPSVKKYRRMIGNNCLFDAVLSNCKDLCGLFKSSQDLRDKCTSILIDEGLPTIPDGLPAGEQYIQAISKIAEKPISVTKGDANYLISYSENYNTKTPISIQHVGSDLNGHWM